MPSKKKTTKKASRLTGNLSKEQSNRIASASSILFAGVCIILIGYWQDNENLELLMVGFGAAFLVVGAVLSYLATQKK
jgi:hypothetical protein